MAHQSYDAFVNNQQNPFVEQMRREGDEEQGGARNPVKGRDTQPLIAGIETKAEPIPEDSENDDEGAPNSGFVIHVATEPGKARWNHIEDLDSFFSRMYRYHQRHGFSVMVLEESLQLVQFGFVVVLVVYLFHCVNYPVLFREEVADFTKHTISDVLYTSETCLASFTPFTWAALTLSGLFLSLRFVRAVHHFIQFYDIKLFFNTALKIMDCELDNLTWHEVQKRIMDVQSEQQMCIHKEQLSELDIYHRILRFKNYSVAMMNKSILPARVYLPFLGDTAVLSRGLRYNIDWILFGGPWSPFENNWHLREEYKRANRRLELAEKLSSQITWVALANLVLAPVIFLWQLMYFFCSYGDLLKREPGVLGVRSWSQYGRWYLRHFNELDHELEARLSRAYRPAVRYMSSFTSPLMAVIAKNVVFMCGAVLSVLLILTAYDEDVMQVQHVITVITLLTVVVVAFRVFIPDENMIWCPEQLLTAVLAHVHYLPITWRGKAHTSHVQKEFGLLFQFKATFLLNELFSPLLTPFVLYFSLRPRALDIVDFFRNFTVSVVGVGDVCSFAQMDIRKHGNPDWQLTPSTEGEPDFKPTCETNQYTQGEHGKTELSLMHFTKTNPAWKMPDDVKKFVHGINRHAVNDILRTRINAGVSNTAMGQSLLSLGSMGGEYSSVVQSILHATNMNNSQMGISLFAHPTNAGISRMGSGGGGGGGQQQQAVSGFQQAQNLPYSMERMLQQNLINEASSSQIPMRSTLLTDIAEDEDCMQEMHMDPRQTYSTCPIRQRRSPMTSSLRGGLSRREGPLELSDDGILASLNVRPSDVPPVELAATDMCLSTLYLHELHHRHITRRGIRLEQSQRHLWQTPHQQQQAGGGEPVAGPSTMSMGRVGGGGGGSSGPAERTPLLGAKKS